MKMAERPETTGKRVMMIGKTSAGKTSLCQVLQGQALTRKKTQAIEVLHQRIIDTPGEYLEQRGMYRALLVTAAEAEMIVFVLDATQERNYFPPQFATMFQKEVIGVITKKDLATEEELLRANQQLLHAGVKKIVEVSNVTGEGISRLQRWICG